MKINYLAKIIVVATLVSTICGCVSLRVGSVQQNFTKQTVTARQRKLRAVRKFHVLGALSITTKQQTYLANYDWQQQGDSYTIRLTSSLNAVSYVISGRPGHVVLQQSNKKPVIAKSLAQIMQTEVGYSLPLLGMRYWIFGLPAPGKHSSKFDNYGHLQQLSQQGWQINYLIYATHAHLDLPRLLRVTGHGLAIKYVIKQWQF